MYYDSQRKLAFVMPPRTGSTMFDYLLSQWGLESDKNRHLKPKNVKIENFNEYVVYGFFRNPEDRFLSLLRSFQQKYANFKKIQESIGIPSDEFKSFNYDQLVDCFDKYCNSLPFFFHSQTEWLSDAQLLDFNNYTNEILRVAKMLNVSSVYIGKMNESQKTNEIPSQRVIDFVRSQYADDYRLWKERAK